MELNEQKEQFSRAYVRAVAAAAGVNLYELDVDDQSVDLGFAIRQKDGFRHSPRLEAQLKSTSQPKLGDSHLHFPLKIKNFDDLRTLSMIPRILIVVVLLADLDEWVHQSEEELALRKCPYWISLRGLPATHNKTSATILLPRKNHFSIGSLLAALQRIDQGELP